MQREASPADTRKPEVGGEQPLNMIRNVAADIGEDCDGVSDEDVLDDWFIESLKMYKDLYVYQLECPTQVMDWTSSKSVCAAGHSSSRCEILELELPQRLSTAQNQGLCAGRDFRVLHGSFSEAPVRRLAHIPGTRCIVTNDGRSSKLQVWEVAGDTSDVIKRSRTIEGCSSSSNPAGGSRVAARRWARPQVLHGATCSQVQLTDLTSGQTLFKLESAGAEPLTSLQFISDTVFLAGQCDGAYLLADVRTPGTTQQLALPPSPDPTSSSSALWWTAVAAEQPTEPRLLRVASSGLMETSDLRNVGRAIGRARLIVHTRLLPMNDSITASWAPMLDNCVAVSGFRGVVQIFDTSLWGSELQDARPLFEHRGHAPSPSTAITVSTHMWHQERPRTLLSAATDGSVHVWDWIDQSAGS